MKTLLPPFNCQQATLLIERRAHEPLPFTSRFRLWAHLHLCPYCRRYAFQSPFIARQAKAAANAATSAPGALPPAAQRRLQLLLDAHSGTVA